MSLTITTSRTVREEKTLRVPTSWGMFSGKGDKRITAIAEEAVGRIEKLAEESKFGPTKKEIRAELTRMVTKWVRMWSTKTYPESSDTAVRGAVGSFTERLAEASGAFTRFGARDAWDEAYTAAQRKVRS